MLRRHDYLLGIGLLIGAVTVTAVVSYRAARQLHENSRWVAHTHEVLAAVQQLDTALTAAETSQRGYIITGDAAHLAPFEASRAAIEPLLQNLTRLTEDNASQQERLRRLAMLINGRLEILAKNLELRKSIGFEAARDSIAGGDGQAAVDEIRNVTSQFTQHERDLLSMRTVQNEGAFRALSWCILCGLVTGLLAIWVFLRLLQRYLNKIEKSTAIIHAQRELQHAMLISIGDGVIATDPSGRITLLNKAAQHLTGWPQDEAVGRPLDDVFRIVNETTGDPVVNPALRALTEGRIMGLANHSILISRDGTRWPIDDSAAPIRNQQHEISGAILVFREISERKRQEAELMRHAQSLREADQRKDEFLATLAHELRNPLSPLSNALQLWPLVENDRSEMEQLRLIMERQLAQLKRLVDDLLDVSRITRGKIELRKQHVELQTVIHGAIEGVDPAIAASKQHLTVELPDDPVMIEADVARLTQVFGNILQNAVKYTGRGGQIRVAAHTHDGRATVTITDNGPGIPPHLLSHIFEMFQQVDQTLERSHGGLGIGLTLVKRLVEMHDGTVAAHSDGPGHGSEFAVQLPIARVDSPANAKTSNDGRREARLPALRALVVDDVPAAAKTLALMLQTIGQEVSILNDPRQALDRIRQDRPDIVFLDIAMPGMNGYDVARLIRDQADLKELYLVALTGYGQEEDRRRAFEAGFNQHLIKPTSIEALEQLLMTRPAREQPVA